MLRSERNPSSASSLNSHKIEFFKLTLETNSHIIVDTPGQIEIFTWSASGAIITDAMASALPTVIAYVIDTPRTTAPATFMSNMLYACRCALPLRYALIDQGLKRVHVTVFCTKLDFLLFSSSTKPILHLTSSRSNGCETLRHSRLL